MPTLVSGARVKEAVEKGTFIIGGDPGSVEAVKYDFHLGDRVLKAEYGQPKEIAAIPEEKRVIAPGETVFVLTKERLELPHDMIAVLVPKRKIAHGGIGIVGGLAVDPEYKGVLVVGMHNFASRPYHLRPGKKLIAAMFYELAVDEITKEEVTAPAEITDFPDDIIDLISKYQPADLAGLKEELAQTKRDLQDLKVEITTDKTWRDTFKNDLIELKHAVAETNRSITRLGENLEKEAQLRAGEDKALGDRLTSMSNMFFGFNLIRAIIVALVLIGLGALAEFFVPKLFAPTPSPSTTISRPAPTSH